MARKPVTLKKKTAPRKAKEEETPFIFNPAEHVLVPKHEKVSQEEIKNLYATYHASMKELPKISITDPAIRHLAIKGGDVIKITRKSPTAGETIFYRGVVDE